MKEFKLQIVTPDGVCYDGVAESLLVRATDGDVEILSGHEDYVCALGVGRARILLDGEARYAAASGGFLTVSQGEVKLVCVTFEFGEDIDLARARAAKENAEKKISDAKDDIALELAKAKLARAVSRINAAQLK